jgi:hypothetical protein
MDILKGFQIESPRTFVPWEISEEELVELIGAANPKRVTDGYYTIKCTSLAGLSHMLGFHFHPRSRGKLVELEFFRESYPDYPDLSKSFTEFQMHLETTFGPPIEGRGTHSCAWYFGTLALNHYIQERFGPEEHVRMKKLAARS